MMVLRKVLASLTIFYVTAFEALANDPCTFGPPGSLVCQGDQSNGIVASTAGGTLTVYALTSDIAPTSGGGIRFFSPIGGSVDVVTYGDLDAGGPFKILIQNGSGIYATTSRSLSDANVALSIGSASVDSDRTIITTNGHGILAGSALNLTATSGFVKANGGDVAVTSAGGVSATTWGHGIAAEASTAAHSYGTNATAIGGGTRITSANIDTAGNYYHGIYASNQTYSTTERTGWSYALGGDIAIDSAGSVTTHGDGAFGIHAWSIVNAQTKTQGTDATAIGGRIDVAAAAIETTANGAAGIYVTANIGAVSYGSGSASSTGADITVTSNGKIEAGGAGIDARGSGHGFEYERCGRSCFRQDCCGKRGNSNSGQLLIWTQHRELG